jgi:vacuolar-type H+-ATPase subunit E/Vma4
VVTDSESLTVEYARHVKDSASQVLEEIKRTATQATASEQARMQSEIDRRHGEIRAALAAFLRVVRLPVTQSSVSMRLHEGATKFRRCSRASTR